MDEKPVRDIAAAVVRREDGRVLLLRRAPEHHPGGGLWCFVTGHIEVGELPRDASIRELKEELGVDAEPVLGGRIVVVEISTAILHVYPFLFDVPDFPVVLDWEHTDSVWIEPKQLYEYAFVQQLDEDLMALGLLP